MLRKTAVSAERSAAPSSTNYWQVFQTAISPVLDFLVQAGLVLILVIFILIHREDLRNRLLRLSGTRHLTTLTRALDEQMVTHKRVGDCLIDLGFISNADLREFTRLQTSETAYRIFLWRAGSYEFAQSESPPEAVSAGAGASAAKSIGTSSNAPTSPVMTRFAQVPR